MVHAPKSYGGKSYMRQSPSCELYVKPGLIRGQPDHAVLDYAKRSRRDLVVRKSKGLHH